MGNYDHHVKGVLNIDVEPRINPDLCTGQTVPQKSGNIRPDLEAEESKEGIDLRYSSVLTKIMGKSSSERLYPVDLGVPLKQRAERPYKSDSFVAIADMKDSGWSYQLLYPLLFLDLGPERMNG